LYFLDPTTAGNLTTSAPTAEGEIVLKIGKALSTTVLEVTIGQTILL